jgi:hypothetical protein
VGVSLVCLFALVGLVFAVKHEIAPFPPVFWFSISSALAASIVICRPHSPFMVSLVLFFALGFWVKFVFHVITGLPWVEPIGDFSRSQDEWATVLYAASAVMLGTVPPALLSTKYSVSRIVPARYGLLAPWLWTVTLAGGLVLFVANYYFEFLRVGIDTPTILPFPGNAVFSFLLTYGISLAIACIGYWSWCAGRLPMPLLIALGIIVGALSSWSTLSRLQIFLHSGAFVLGWATCSKIADARLSLRTGLLLSAFFALCFAVSLAAVSWERFVLHAVPQVSAPEVTQDKHSDVPSQTAQAEKPSGEQGARDHGVTPQAASDMAGQVALLFVDRWVGLEGLMATAAYQGKGLSLLARAINERPSVGNDGIYQQISRAPHVKVAGRTFLTLAGGAAVLYYSGSIMFVFVGIMLFCFAALVLERFALWATASPFAMSVVAVAASNSIAQLNQPYSLFVLWIELLAACGAIYILRRVLVGPDSGTDNLRFRRSSHSPKT